MNKHIFKLFVIAFLLFSGFGCKKAYTPPPTIKTDYNSVLVVEGFINNGAGKTKFTLSKASQLDHVTTFMPEKTATVTVESEQGTIANLIHTGEGIYENSLSINPTQKYRLRIKVNATQEYLSDFVEVKTTPDIDKISWKETSKGVEILADTHDDQHASKYYMWNFEETWLFNSNFDSDFIFKQNSMHERLPEESVFRCWTSSQSTSIILGSTSKLTSDVIENQPIAVIPPKSEKLGIRYSILVKQHVITKEAFEYLEVMKKNTEELGSIFGPLPSQQIGNIKNIHNDKEPVVGFVYATSQKEKRIFIDNKDISYLWAVEQPNEKVCSQAELFLGIANLNTYFGAGQLVPTYGIYDATGQTIIGYGYAPRICVDCTVRGTKQKPIFWQ